MKWFLVAMVFSGSGSLAAQKMLLAADPDRQAAVFEVDGLANGAAQEAVVAGRFGRVERACVADLVAILRSRAARPGDHIAAVGPDHVVALGAPDWIGSVEAMLVHMRRAASKQLQVDVRFCRVSDALLTGEIDRGHLPGFARVPGDPTTSICLLDDEKAVRLVKSLRGQKADLIQAPQIVATELDRGRIAVGKNVDYVRGYETVNDTVPQKTKPLVDRVWSGNDLSFVFATTGNNQVSLNVVSQRQDVDLPMREYIATGEMGEAIQVPRLRVACARACPTVSDQSTSVIAARDSDGDWSLTLVTVLEIRSGPPPR